MGPAHRAIADEFACQACGNPSIAVPAALHAEAEVSCGGFGRFLATWSGFCRSVDQTLAHSANAAAPPRVFVP